MQNKTTQRKKTRMPSKKITKKPLEKISKAKIRRLALRRVSTLPLHTRELVYSKNINELRMSLLNSEHFNCAICLELMIAPTVIDCGHSFCIQCIEEMDAEKFRCPICRTQQKIQDLRVSTWMQKLIGEMVVPAMEDADKYSSRKEQFNKKEQERCIGTDMKVEDKVDVKHLKKWMVGTIKHIEENLFGEKILTVQLGNLKIEMNALSRRVGKKGYFSSRQSGRQEQKRSSNQTIILREQVQFDNQDPDYLPTHLFRGVFRMTLSLLRVRPERRIP